MSAQAKKNNKGKVGGGASVDPNDLDDFGIEGVGNGLPFPISRSDFISLQV